MIVFYSGSDCLVVLLLSGRFTIQNVVPQPDGDSSKVKVKVRVNVHGIFSVSSASLIEKQKGEADDVQMDTEPTVQNEGRPEEQVETYVHAQLTTKVISRNVMHLAVQWCSAKELT